MNVSGSGTLNFDLDADENILINGDVITDGTPLTEVRVQEAAGRDTINLKALTVRGFRI